MTGEPVGIRRRRGLVGVLLGALVAPLVTVVAAQPAAAGCAVPRDRDISVTRTVYRTGVKLGVNDKVMLAAFETGWVESHMNNLPCGDRDSQGVFQQRPSQGWKNVRDVEYAATSFFKIAKANNRRYPGWSAGKLAQSVQRSAFPSRYDQVAGKARSMINEVKQPPPPPPKPPKPSGAIGNKWKAEGGNTSPIGKPTTDERDAAGKGRYQIFKKGVILWHPDTGAWMIRGAIHTAFYQGGDEHKIGYPLMDEQPGWKSPTGTTGKYQKFDKKMILWSSKTGAHIVEGAILTHFLTHGREGAYGYPTSGEKHDGTIVRQTFERGTMRWESGKGTVWIPNRKWVMTKAEPTEQPG